MRPAKNAAAHVGRIGALAVALGVGAAVATSPGVAWADPDSGSGGGSSSSSTSSSSSDGSGGAKKSTDTSSKKQSGTSSSGESSGADDSAGSGSTKDRKPRWGRQVRDNIRGAIRDADKAREDRLAARKARVDARKAATTEAAPVDEEIVTETPPTGSGTDPRPQPVTTAPDDVTTTKPLRRKDSAPALAPVAPSVEAVTDKPAPTRAAAPRAEVVAKEITQRSVDTFAAARVTAQDAFGNAARTVPTDVSPTAAARTMSFTPPAATETPRMAQLVSNVLMAVGIAPIAAGLPTGPAAPPAIWALLAAARREFDRTLRPASLTSGQQAGVVAAAAAVVNPLPDRLPSTPIGWVTGVTNSGGWDQTNNTDLPPGPGLPDGGFDIRGTDLGIMWDNMQSGDTRFILTAFGDTFSEQGMQGNWRNNVLLLSTDRNLSDGFSLLQTGPAFQFIPKVPALLGPFANEVTVIPTSGVAVLGEQYVNYMSVRSWDTPGRWTTNYSAIAVFEPGPDGGEWVVVPSTVRSAGWFRSSTPYVPGSQNFQQAAYVLQPEDQVEDGQPRYLYAFGTPSGRAGSAYLSRVAEGDVTDLSKYEYWDGDSWVRGNPAVAAPVIGDSPNSAGLFGFAVDWANDPNVFGGYLGGLFGAKTGGNVSEMSVQYNEYLDRYVVLYADGNNDIQMRVAERPEGPWSDPITIAESAEYPGLYAPMIHPWSGTGMLTDDDGAADLNHLYWNMSIWGDYNVILMQTDLEPLTYV